MTVYEECNIDRIMYLISWDRSESEQQEGLSMARKVSCLKAFCQPGCRDYSKDVWENCAVILCERSDEELEFYISDMLLWLEDLNWPGASQIQERLVQFQKVDMLAMWLNSWVPALKQLKKLPSFICLSQAVLTLIQSATPSSTRLHRLSVLPTVRTF